MNNWRLLLLAVVVVVQPIGSFTESNFIDGRECCERSEDANPYGYRKTDERGSLDGNRENLRTNEQHRLRTLNGYREDRRYDTIRGPMLTRSESLERNERRISLELSRFTGHRLVREQERRYRDTLARTRETREEQSRSRDESRDIVGQNERDSRQSRYRDTLDTTRTFRLSRDARDTRSVERESRNTMSRLQIRAIRSNEERSITQNRKTIMLKREQEDVARLDTKRDSKLNDLVRYESRIQLDNNIERRIFDRRTQEDGTEFGRSRFSNTRINMIHTQRTVEQNERNNRDSRDVRVELRRAQRDAELRESVNAVRRDNERTSADRMRESRDETRLGQDRIETRTNQRIDERRQQRDEIRRAMDTLRNPEKRHLDSRQIRASRTLDMTTRNDERMERRSLSMPRESRDSRLSRSSERNVREEKPARIRNMMEMISDERMQRDTNGISRDIIEPRQELRRTASRMDIRESSEERKHHRDIRKSIVLRQEARRIVSRRDVRESSEERRQQYDVSRLSRDRTISAIREVRNRDSTQESRKNIKESSEEQRLQREDSRLSRVRISPLREVRDISEREFHKDAKKSSERRQRDNNLSRYRISDAMLSKDRTVRDAEGSQETRRVVSSLNTELYFHKLVSRSRQDVRDNEKTDLRRQVLERSMERAHMTRSMSVERRNDARETSRASRSTETSRIRENTKTNERDERQQTRDRAGNMKQRVTRNVATPQRLDTRRASRSESNRLERIVRNRDVKESGDQEKTDRNVVQRITRNVASPQRIDTRRSPRTESIRLERLVRDRADIRENEKREMQRKERDSDRTRILLNRRSSESVIAERRRDRESAKDAREVRMTRNRSEVRSDRVLAARRQENRDSRNNRGEVRSERVLAESRQENRKATRDSRNNRGDVRSERILAERRQENRGDTRDSRNNRGEVRSNRVLALRTQYSELRNVRREIDTRHRRDAAKHSRERSLQHESRDITERLTERSRDSVVRNERARSNEKEVRSDWIDARQESTNDIQANNILTLERGGSTDRFANAGKLEETRFRNDAVTYRDAFVQESEPASNWQMVFYTLQGVYLCGLLVQMLTEKSNKTKRTFNWWSSPKNLIKMD